MIDRHGIIAAVERAVAGPEAKPGYTALEEMGIPDLAFEAVVCRHPDAFSAEAVEGSRQRMKERNQEPGEPDTVCNVAATQCAVDRPIRPGRCPIQRKNRAPANPCKNPDQELVGRKEEENQSTVNSLASKLNCKSLSTGSLLSHRLNCSSIKPAAMLAVKMVLLAVQAPACASSAAKSVVG